MRAQGLAARLFALALAAACPMAAYADSPPACAGRDLSADPAVKPDFAKWSDDLKNGDGLLWKIEKPGLAPSYLYGTVHSSQPGPMALARKAAEYISGAKSVATELGGPFDAADKVNMGASLVAAALSPDADTFAGEIPPDEVEGIEALALKHGFPKEMAHHIQLWFLALSVGLPACEIAGQQQGAPEVDDTLAQIARAHGVPVTALESTDEQVSVMSHAPARLGAIMLRASARNPALNEDGFATLMALYLKKTPARALAVLDAAPGVSDEERKAETEFTQLLLVGRNETMIQRAAPLLSRGGAFIAVGALHLSGKGGLVERARAAGYAVTKVW